MGKHNENPAVPPQRPVRNWQRRRILELVRKHDRPVDAVELATQLGLHTTTVRFHLDALCDDGVVERTRITRARVGRPRTGYRTVRERLDYRLLAEILALELGSTAHTRRRRAESAGQRWAQRIMDNAPREEAAGQSVSENAALEARSANIARVFSRMGFVPELTAAERTTAGGQRTIRLHNCPVRDLAIAHPDVACALHRGLLRGLAATPVTGEKGLAASGPATQVELEPFVEPELCLARVIMRD
ncbi:MAG: winged helix-turn-helix transcriptional regulator [Mycobacterium sp.]|nr:winged helix-turn-helix transcriptional regulator [Mycobacterium sp.]